MAPRKAKQAAAENIAATSADVTPPKKRKVTAKTASTEDEAPRQTKGKAKQQAKADKQNEMVVADEPAKKSRGKQKNAAGTTADTAAVAAATKNDTKSKSKKQIAKKPEDAAVNDDADKKVAEKTTRGSSKAATTAKKAGTKTAVVKPKTKASPVAAKKQRTRAMDEVAAEDAEKKSAVDRNPAMRVTRRMKMIEENDVPPAQPAAKITKKRKNEDTDEAVGRMQVTKEKEEEEEEENEEEEEERKNEAKAASKKLRGKAKKIETDDTPMPTSKGKSKKNLAKEVAKPSPEETEMKEQNSKEQNIATQEDNSKAKNMKNAKKGNVKKTVSKTKLDAAVEKGDEAQAEEPTTLEMDVKENGETHVAEVKEKQKKKNTGKMNAAMNGKVEAKGKQKKGQMAAAVEETEVTKDVITEKTTAKMNSLEIDDENDMKDVSSSKDDSVSQNKEEKNEDNADSTKKESNINISIDEMERSGSFVCL